MYRRLIRHKLPILVLSLVLLTLSATAINAQPAPQSTAAATADSTDTPVPSATPIATGTATRVPARTILYFAALGFSAQTVPNVNNLQVVSVTPNGPAIRSGLLVNDLIVAVEGQPITSSNLSAVINYLNTTTARATITVDRGGRTFSVTIVVAQPTPFPAPTISPSTGKLGVAYQMVTEQLAADKHLTVKYGAYILEVAQDRPAFAAGIKPGDVVTEVEGDKVDLKRNLGFRMIPYNTGDEVTLTVVRGGETIKVKVVLGVMRGIAWAGQGDAA